MWALYLLLHNRRIEPPVSVPNEKGTMPLDTDTHEPPLDPPEDPVTFILYHGESLIGSNYTQPFAAEPLGGTS